jgi:hypothetical protein
MRRKRDSSSTPDPAVSTAVPRGRVSRRRFLALIAAGSVAAAGSAGAALAADAAPKPPKPKKAAAALAKPAADVYAAPPPPSAAIAKGLAEARESVAGQLRKIREYELPAGSELGFAFRPLRAARPRRERRGAR